MKLVMNENLQKHMRIFAVSGSKFDLFSKLYKLTNSDWFLFVVTKTPWPSVKPQGIFPWMCGVKILQ